MTLNFVRYKHSRFSARFPESFRYSRSHYWMSPQKSGEWRVGFTKFATRMLGELVEADFRVAVGDLVKSGDEIGSVEGFKAASDIFCGMEGVFAGGNPVLLEDACIIRTSPYVDGWLYAVKGEPESQSLDVHGYIEYLDGIIRRMHEQEKSADSETL
ncbi:MAG: glycine cleavage system protein H [Akkermansiaceae bacterium]|jgi:glycine cleavage system H protein